MGLERKVNVLAAAVASAVLSFGCTDKVENPKPSVSQAQVQESVAPSAYQSAASSESVEPWYMIMTSSGVLYKVYTSEAVENLKQYIDEGFISKKAELEFYVLLDENSDDCISVEESKNAEKYFQIVNAEKEEEF